MYAGRQNYDRLSLDWTAFFVAPVSVGVPVFQALKCSHEADVCWRVLEETKKKVHPSDVGCVCCCVVCCLSSTNIHPSTTTLKIHSFIPSFVSLHQRQVNAIARR
jgi:hypothetical protein